MDLEIRPATATDVTSSGDGFSIARADGWRSGAHARVATVGGEVVAWGLRMPNAVHPTRDLGHVEVLPEHRRQGIGMSLLRLIQGLSPVPLSAKLRHLSDPDQPEEVDAPGGTGEVMNAFMAAVGVHVYQRCPLVEFRADGEAVAAWCRDQQTQPEGVGASAGFDLVSGRELTDDEYISAFTDVYLWQHASWAPTGDSAVIRNEAKEWLAESSRQHCFATKRDGQITAIFDSFPEPTKPGCQKHCVVGEAVDASLPTARHDVKVCLAKVVESLAEYDTTHTADFHMTDPNSWPVLNTLPGLHVIGECALVETVAPH